MKFAAFHLLLASFLTTHFAAFAADLPTPDSNLKIQNGTTLHFKTIKLAEPRDLNGAYLRLVLEVPTVSEGYSQAQQEVWWKVAKVNALKYLWDKKSTVTVVVKPVYIGGPDLPMQKIFSARSDNGADQVDNVISLALSPYSKDPPSQLQLSFTVARSSTVDSNIVKTAAAAFKAASALATGGILSNLANKDFSTAATSMDDAIGKLLATGSPETLTLELDPYNVDRVIILADNSDDKNQPLVSVKYDIVKSLIGGGDPHKVNVEPADITSYSLSTNFESANPKAISIREFLNRKDDAGKSVASLIEPDTKEALQLFCDVAPAKLAEIGLNKYDRAAVMYAYLRNSKWNKSTSTRPRNDADDRCLEATTLLKENMPQLKLRSYSEIDKGERSVREPIKIWYADTLWKTIPTAFQSKNVATWEKVFDTNVQVSVTGAALQLAPDTEALLPGGTGYSATGGEAAALLAASDLSYKKGPFSCFELDSTSSAATFTTKCVRLTTNSTSSLSVEFTVGRNYLENTGTGEPKITEIRFISPFSSPPKVVSSPVEPRGMQ